MSRRFPWILALALLAPALPARAFVRETTDFHHPESGRCLWWAGRAVTWKLNASAVTATGCQTAASAATAVATGFAPWGAATRAGEPAACTDFGFVAGGTTAAKGVGRDGTNLVVVRAGLCSSFIQPGDPCLASPGACAEKYNCWQDDYGTITIGMTTVSFDRDSGEIFDADMEIFAWDGADSHVGHYLTCGSTTNATCNTPPWGQLDCNYVDLAAVVTHEAGHMLGLDHVCDHAFATPYDACPDQHAVMEPQVGQASQRVLGPDDIEGICTIYPAGKATLTCGSAKKKSSGCATGEGAGLAALALAALALGRRARRA